jgi:hypothetical protein
MKIKLIILFSCFLSTFALGQTAVCQLRNWNDTLDKAFEKCKAFVDVDIQLMDNSTFITGRSLRYPCEFKSIRIWASTNATLLGNGNALCENSSLEFTNIIFDGMNIPGSILFETQKRLEKFSMRNCTVQSFDTPTGRCVIQIIVTTPDIQNNIFRDSLGKGGIICIRNPENRDGKNRVVFENNKTT